MIFSPFWFLTKSDIFCTFLSNSFNFLLFPSIIDALWSSISQEEKFKNSIIDGEYIKYDKYGKFVNLFASFDIYYLNKAHVGKFGFQTKFDDRIIDNNEVEKLPLWNPKNFRK